MLHSYYISHGFQHVRTCNIPGRMSGALFQKDLKQLDGPTVTHRIASHQ